MAGVRSLPLGSVPIPECNSPRKISSECSGNVLRSLVIHGEGAVRYEEAFDGCNSGGTP